MSRARGDDFVRDVMRNSPVLWKRAYIHENRASGNGHSSASCAIIVVVATVRCMGQRSDHEEQRTR